MGCQGREVRWRGRDIVITEEEREDKKDAETAGDGDEGGIGTKESEEWGPGGVEKL